MRCFRNIALAHTSLLALTVAVSTAGTAAAEATAPDAAVVLSKSHPVAAAPQTDGSKGESKAAKPETKLKLAPNDTVIYVGDLHCAHCAKKIASKLYAVKGVVKVRTDIKADVAIVSPQAKKKLDPLALWAAAKTSGFPAVKLVGPAGTYLADPKTKAAQLLPEKTLAPKS